MKNKFYPAFSDFEKSPACLEGSQASTVCLSGKSNMQTEMSMKYWLNDDLRKKRDFLFKEPARTAQ